MKKTPIQVLKPLSMLQVVVPELPNNLSVVTADQWGIPVNTIYKKMPANSRGQFIY